MGKVLKTIFLIVLFISLASSAGIIWIVKFDNNSFYSYELKKQIIKSPTLLRLINLNEPGDARYIYVSAKNPLPVYVYYFEDVKPNENIAGWIDSFIEMTTGRVANISLEVLSMPLKKEYGDSDLNKIHNSFGGKFSREGVLNIVYLTKHAEKSSHAGIALHRDTIFIFKDSLKDLSDSKQVRDRLEESTLMHEWGHLLGLEHVDDPTCIMSEKVEVIDAHFLGERQIPTEFCWETLREIEKIKN